MAITRHRITEKEIELVKYLQAHKVETAQIATIACISEDSVKRILNGTRDKRLAYMREYKAAKRAEAKQPKVEQIEIKEEPKAAAMTDEALYNTMKHAMHDAVSAALEDYTRRLRGVIQVAVQDALKPPLNA